MSYFTWLEAQNVDKYNTFALFFGMERSKSQNQLYFTCLEGSRKLNVSYFTCLEAQNVEKYFKFAWFLDAQGV